MLFWCFLFSNVTWHFFFLLCVFSVTLWKWLLLTLVAMPLYRWLGWCWLTNWLPRICHLWSAYLGLQHFLWGICWVGRGFGVAGFGAVWLDSPRGRAVWNNWRVTGPFALCLVPSPHALWLYCHAECASACLLPDFSRVTHSRVKRDFVWLLRPCVLDWCGRWCVNVIRQVVVISLYIFFSSLSPSCQVLLRIWMLNNEVCLGAWYALDMHWEYCLNVVAECSKIYWRCISMNRCFTC